MWPGYEARTMAAEQETDTSRSVVKTYVPAYQKETWQADADELDMSQSEFVRSMVQAGRRGFELADGESGPTGESPSEHNETTQDGGEGSDLEAAIRRALREGNHLSWDELLAVLTDDIEERLDDALQELQANNEVQYSGRNGGYTLASDE
jgi:hypothetical protein